MHFLSILDSDIFRVGIDFGLEVILGFRSFVFLFLFPLLDLELHPGHVQGLEHFLDLLDLMYLQE